MRIGEGENRVSGSRLVPLALAILRLLLILSAAVQSGHVPMLSGGPAFLALLAYGLVWPAAALVLHLFGWPRGGAGYRAVLAADLLLASCLLLYGTPVVVLSLLILHGLVWRACGGRLAISPTLPAYLLLWAALWLIRPDRALGWIAAHPRPDDLANWGVPFALVVAIFWLDDQRQGALTRLASDMAIDPMTVTDRPFAADFGPWTERVGALFGRRSLCVVGLFSRQGRFDLFSSQPIAVERASLERLARGLADQLPDSLTTVIDRRRTAAAAGADRDGAVSLPDALLQALRAHPCLRQPVVMARSLDVGASRGVALLAHDLPTGPLLGRETSRVDQALDAIAGRIARVVEMRRAFLGEAREIARRDLHDGVLQLLAAIRMRLLTILQDQRMQHCFCAGDIRTTADIIALEQARLRALLESSVDDSQAVNLVEMLKLCIATIALQWEVDIHFVSEEEAIPMNREAVNNVEFLLREIVANATRHSEAKRIDCTLAIKDSDLVISLIDLSGDSGRASSGPEAGLRHDPLDSESLRQRLKLVNGRAYTEGLKKGTLLAIAIPLVYKDG